MVRDHMKQLQSHQYAEIGRQMGLTPEEVSHHLEIIKRLDPKPGLKYSPDRSTYIIPDVFVVKEGDDYKIVLNDDGLPKLRISPTYKRMLDDKEPGSEETRNYVKEKLRSALWLLKSVDQRQRTIYKVAESIVRHQRGFLDHGIAHLRPLVLRDVATDIGMHESTVSRVVANKYMHTPRGVYELRFFFHSGITSTHGRGGQLGHHQGQDPEDDRGGGRRPGRSRTRASPSCWAATACPWPAAPWPSTARSCASRPPTFASRSTDDGRRTGAGAGRWPHEDRVHRPADGGARAARALAERKLAKLARSCAASPTST